MDKVYPPVMQLWSITMLSKELDEPRKCFFFHRYVRFLEGGVFEPVIEIGNYLGQYLGQYVWEIVGQYVGESLANHGATTRPSTVWV